MPDKKEKSAEDLLADYLNDLETNRSSNVPFQTRKDKSFLGLLKTARFFTLFNKKMEPQKQFIKSLRAEIEKQAKAMETKIAPKPFWSVFSGRRVLKVGYALGVVIFAVFIAVAAITFTDLDDNQLVVLKPDTNQAAISTSDRNTNQEVQVPPEIQEGQITPQEPPQNSQDQEPVQDQPEDQAPEEADDPSGGTKEPDNVALLASNLVRLNSLAEGLETDSLFVQTSSAVNNFSFSGLLGSEADLSDFSADLSAINFE